MNREGKKCVLYPRVSTEMQVDGYSLEGQKNGLKRFADREEMEIVGIYEDAGKSGKSIEGRPAFKKMLSDIKNGLEIDYILVYKLSRFGRNAADILNSLEFVQSYGINLICIEEGIDSSQTSGKLLISVLSAVAEIERENIIEQTMNGRREKARQGGWNGGFAPYGYYLKDNQLLIEETEAEAIRIIFDKFANSDIGLGGVAKYLNLQGIKKIPRQNGTLETWSSHFIRLILDNPVYCGKIAYGRRTREKVKGTKNEYKQVHAEDYILEDGQHEGIISEELWQKVHAKRMATGIKQPSKIGKDRSHLLTGILKCPLCGSSMYTNKHAWTNKDGTYKEVYYYICGRNKQERGHHCDYKASLRKTDIEPLVIEAVKELVSDKYFAKEIEKRIGVQTDTTAIDKELANYESKLKEVDLNKARLEREIDNLPVDTRFRERKIHDMTLRLDALYDTIVELEERIEDAKLRKSSIEMETITLDNIYKLMLNFGKLYDIISDEEKKSLITYLIKEIQIYPNGESEQPLKSIEFNFPIYRDGQEVRRLLWEKGNTVESVVRDIISPQFTLPAGATASDITLETYACTGKDGDTYTWSKNADAMDATAAIDGNNVSVTGFNFSENYVGTVTNNGSVTYRGHKLVIRFSVKPQPGFLGGNNVPTNAGAGVYENKDSETPVREFPQPTVNVPIQPVTVAAQDYNVYLLGGLTASQLQSGSTVQVGSISLDLTKATDSDHPYGLEPWQTAYVDITVSLTGPDGSPVTDLAQLRADTSYTVSVTVSPKTEPQADSSGTPATKQSGSATGKVNVFKPTLTYEDGTVYYGDTFDRATLPGYRTSTSWFHNGTDAATVTMTGTAPALTYGYTYDTTLLTDIVNTKQDIPVKATISIGETDITGDTTFLHTDCAGETWSHTSGDPAFLLHVRTCALTVTKTGGADGEPYVFNVYRNGNPYTQVTVVGSSSVSIYELPVGKYTIEEDTGWSWRYDAAYDPDKPDGCTLTAGHNSGSITCTNTLKNDRWLNGFSDVIANIFGIRH